MCSIPPYHCEFRQQEEALREDRKKREALREKERQQEHEAELQQKKKEVCSLGLAGHQC